MSETFFHDFVLLPLQKETTVVRMLKKDKSPQSTVLSSCDQSVHLISRSYHVINNPSSMMLVLKLIEGRKTKKLPLMKGDKGKAKTISIDPADQAV